MTTTSYLMESPTEADRLERKTVYDETVRQLTTVGLRPGMRCLDAGAGTGAVARCMADLVGPRGSVIALDASTDRIRVGEALASEHDNLEFALHELGNGGFPHTGFDLTWSRFTFEYLPDPERVLAELISLTAPGGKIVVGDLDGSCLWHHPIPAALADGLDIIAKSLAGRWDPHMGRKVFSLMQRAGLRDLAVHVLPHNLVAGSIDEDALANWEAKFRTVRPMVESAFGGLANYDAFTADFMDFIQRGDTFSYAILILVEGVVPD